VDAAGTAVAYQADMIDHDTHLAWSVAWSVAGRSWSPASPAWSATWRS
jgi:hypothetical protein